MINADTGSFYHYSVLKSELTDALDIKPDGIYCDLTLGGGGHSEQIAKRLTTGRLICVDTDTDAIKASQTRLASYKDKITYIHGNFRNIATLLDGIGVDVIDGAAADLGVSSYQLDNAERGFSYMQDAPLDMRMDANAPVSAYDIVNGKSEGELKKIIYTYGEENFAPSIARKIVQYRENKPVETTLELVDIIKSAMPEKAKVGGHHPAKRTFQAIRIAVNGELDAVEEMLASVISRLAPGGRLAVITFHSLEDRIVKCGFSDAATGCTCPPSFPVCVCGHKAAVRILTKKPVLPGESELAENPRSRSAKLRVCEKL